LSPRISITVTVMLSLMMMLSFFLRERTSIAAPHLSSNSGGGVPFISMGKGGSVTK
jgi:hypothetical protein